LGGDGVRAGLVEVGQGHRRAGGGEGSRGGLADTAGGAADEGHLAGERLFAGGDRSGHVTSFDSLD
jgi:hypothetical protein